MNVFLVAETTDPVTTFEGTRIFPDFAFAVDSIPPVDVLVVPSAEHHLDTDLENASMIQWVRKTAEKAEWVTSHCDGAFVLAKAGLLNGKEATTFPSDIPAFRKMFPEVQVHENVLFVHDGKYITSVGGARSFEAALYLCEYIYGKKVAEEIARGMVIDWNLDSISHIRNQ